MKQEHFTEHYSDVPQPYGQSGAAHGNEHLTESETLAENGQLTESESLALNGNLSGSEASTEDGQLSQNGTHIDNKMLTNQITPIEQESLNKADPQQNVGQPNKSNDEIQNEQRSQVKKRQVVQLQLEESVQFRTLYGVWTMIILVFIVSTAGIIWRGGAIEWLLFSTSGFLIVSSGLLPWLAAQGLGLERQIETGAGEITAELKLLRSAAIPSVWYGVIETFKNKSKLTDRMIPYRMMFTPLFHKTMTAQYQIKQLPRGCYDTLPTEIIVGDWLGITCFKRKIDLPEQLMILPQTAETTDGSYLQSFTAQRWKTNNQMNGQEQLPYQRQSDKQLQSNFASSAGGQQSQHNAEHITRPYIEGDNYRRIDMFAAARGRGLHTKIQANDVQQPPFCIVFDQCSAAFQGGNKEQFFEAMIGWGLYDTVMEGKTQPVSIVTDDWNFEYRSEQDELELRYLLAKLRADVQQHMQVRLPQLAALLPSHGHIRVYSGDWREADNWVALAELASLKGSTVELHFVTASRVMTFAMREMHKELEQYGFKVVWRYCPIEQTPQYIMEGVERYASS